MTLQKNDALYHCALTDRWEVRPPAVSAKHHHDGKMTARVISRPFLRMTQVRRYQNVSILDLIGAKDDGGDRNEIQRRAS